MNAPDRPFGRWHDLVLIVIGFLLTGVVGSFISAEIQSRADARSRRQSEEQEQAQQAAERLAREVERASHFYAEFSQLLDARRYHALRLAHELKSNPSGQYLDTIRSDYMAAVIRYNERLTSTLVFLQRYFGSDVTDCFELEIGPKFRAIHSALNRQAPDARVALEEIEALGFVIYELNFQILTMLQEERIGRYNPTILTAPRPARKAAREGQS